MTDKERILCEEVIAHLLEFLDGETDPMHSERIAGHLAECHACFSRAEFERALQRRLRTLDNPPPSPALRQRIRAILDEF